MDVLFISSSNKFNSELQLIIDLFDNGLERLHLRKPKFSKNRLIEYLEAIPQKYHDRIILHSHYSLAVKYKLQGIHLGRSIKKKPTKVAWTRFWLRFRHPKIVFTTSCYSLLCLLEDKDDYDSVILSPIFDSISKRGYTAAFEEDQLRSILYKTKHKVIAMGGIDKSKVHKSFELGFSGIMLSGIMWDADKNARIPLFESIKEGADDPKKTIPKIVIKPVNLKM